MRLDTLRDGIGIAGGTCLQLCCSSKTYRVARMTVEDLHEKRRKAAQKHKAGKRLTYEETALMMWDESKEARPMSAMGIFKIEKRALEKLRSALGEYGISSLDDIFEPKDREIAKKTNMSEHS